MRTCASIISSFNERVGNKEAIAPDEWMLGAMFLNTLIGEEQGRLFDTEQEYMRQCLKWIELGESNAVAEKKAKMTSEYILFKKQQAFVKQVEEFIRLAKKHATINHEQGA